MEYAPRGRWEGALANSGGIAPDEREQTGPDGVSQIRHGASSAFDFVFTYSSHRTIRQLDAALQNGFAEMVPMAAGGPFMVAARATVFVSQHIKLAGVLNILRCFF